MKNLKLIQFIKYLIDYNNIGYLIILVVGTLLCVGGCYSLFLQSPIPLVLILIGISTIVTITSITLMLYTSFTEIKKEYYNFKRGSYYHD